MLEFDLDERQGDDLARDVADDHALGHELVERAQRVDHLVGLNHQVHGDHVGVHERGQLQQPGGRRLPVAQPLDRQIPGRGDGDGVVLRQAERQHPCGLLGERGQVFLHRRARLHQPRCGALQRQGQVPHQVGDRRGVPTTRSRDPAGQVVDALGAAEDVHLQRSGDLGPGLDARGDQDVAGTAARETRQVRPQGLRLRGVVEDDQPPGVRDPRAQRLPRGVGRLRDVLARPQTEPGGQVGQRGVDEVRLVGVHPPDQVVVRLEPVGVLQRDLGLADTAEAVEEGQRQDDRRRAADDLGPQPLQDLVAAGEGPVGPGDVPHGRGHPRGSGCRPRTSPARRSGPLGVAPALEQFLGRVPLPQPGQVETVGTSAGHASIRRLKTGTARSWPVPARVRAAAMACLDPVNFAETTASTRRCWSRWPSAAPFVPPTGQDRMPWISS